MNVLDRVAILLDGEDVKKTLRKRLHRVPTHPEIMAEPERIRLHPAVAALTLYRILYYTADPLTGRATHPLDGSFIDFTSTGAYTRNIQLIRRIENEPDVAVRRGTLVHHGWQIGDAAARQLTAGSRRPLASKDIVPKIQQKGVDMRIGLDIASLALKRLVSTIVVVSGDSDLVPAMRFARREGLRVYLDPLGATSIRPELKTHADLVL